jgi:uncharacterized membrane protein YkvA (DUF1232 family)
VRAAIQAAKREALALYLAMGDPRVPWYAKALAAVVAGYALSPIDLIPDFIPVLGYLDDLLLLPLGVMLVVRLIPRPVMDDLRRQAAARLAQSPAEGRPKSRAGLVAAAIVVALWLILALVLVLAARCQLSSV